MTKHFTKNYKTLGSNIAVHRKQKGLTQEQAAEKLGISRVHLAGIERGIRKPSMDLTFKICELLDISLKDIDYK